MPKLIKMTPSTPSIKNIIEILILDTKDLQMQYANLLARTLSKEAADKFNSTNKILAELESLKAKA